MFLEFSISPFNMRKIRKLVIAGHWKSLPGFWKVCPATRKVYLTIQKVYPATRKVYLGKWGRLFGKPGRLFGWQIRLWHDTCLKMQASLWSTSSLARFLRNFSLFWWVTPKAWLAYSQCLGLFLLFLRIPEWTTTGWWRTTRRTRGSTPSSSSRSFPLIFPTSIQVRVMLFPYYLFGSVTSLPYVSLPV